jgi:prepilin-type N-terminal cleavage/methylation domain-containing protein
MKITRVGIRRGLSLVELLLSLAVVGILAAGVSTLAMGVRATSEYAQGTAEALQHGRVACERIERACSSAKATADYPGFGVLPTAVGSSLFPDTLIVWTPGATPANANGPPLVRELTIFTFDPSKPERLLEITVPGDNRAVPSMTDASGWASLISSIHSSSSAQKVQLTDLLRVGNASSNGSNLRGVIRFETRYLPTTTEWASYKGGSTAWADLSWPLNLYGSQYGVRQAWCRIELQLVPRGLTRQGSDSAANAVPVFGSATLLSTLSK